MLHLAAVLYLASAAASGGPAYFRLDLSASGDLVTIGEPVVKGEMLVFHEYPDGKLMSLRRSEVRSFTRISAEEAAEPITIRPVARQAVPHRPTPAATSASHLKTKGSQSAK